MSVQRLHAFEKTSIQARHSLKRLEALLDNPHASQEEKSIAKSLYRLMMDVRDIIPNEYKDVDLKEV